MPKLSMKPRSYGVNRWMYQDLDDVDLLIEISFSSNCSKTICDVCKHLLKWCLDILMNRVNNKKILKSWLKFTNGQAMQSMQFENIENFLVF